MADLSLLFDRGMARFARDRRFDAFDPEVPLPDPVVEAPPVTDPLAEAHDAGFAAGLAAGRAEALAQAEADRAGSEKISATLTRLDVERSEALRQRLRDTVVALCEATLAPLALDMAALARRVERAAAMFARAEDERVIHLNPADLEAIRQLLPADWTLRADAALERGALRVETATGGVEDGPAQWRLAITEALDLC